MKYSDDRILKQNELKHLVETIAKKIEAPDYCLPTFDNVRGDATPNVEITKDGYYYVISERGNEYERKYTAFLDELLFWIFDSVTFHMACQYEVKNRLEGQDFRILIYKHQVELLNIINPEYSAEIENKAKGLYKE